mmetsp:Transcript_4122/g.10926  ORF Transcript_4122/g.10926 Transcript_4122/m.10926 type:complete len:215 (+) Transcript_4122:556-1200(+)
MHHRPSGELLVWLRDLQCAGWRRLVRRPRWQSGWRRRRRRGHDSNAGAAAGAQERSWPRQSSGTHPCGKWRCEAGRTSQGARLQRLYRDPLVHRIHGASKHHIRCCRGGALASFTKRRNLVLLAGLQLSEGACVAMPTVAAVRAALRLPEPSAWPAVAAGMQGSPLRSETVKARRRIQHKLHSPVADRCLCQRVEQLGTRGRRSNGFLQLQGLQ